MTRRIPEAWKKIAWLAAVVVATFLFWDTWITWPVQLLVVFVHECGHALAAVLTGGEVRGLVIRSDLSGRTVTRGGIGFLILQAGYLASAVFGAVLVVAAARPRTARNSLLVLAVLTAGCALAFAQPVIGITMLFTLLLASLFGWASFHAPDGAVRWGLIYLASVSALYAIVDIREDLLHWSGSGRTDAVLLAERTGIPALVWGGFWALLAVGMIGAALRRVLR